MALNTISRYETETMLEQYLLFHYGVDEDQLPFAFGPKDSLHFPVRCVTECVDRKALPSKAEALELGCAVGRSSFELSKFCKRVLAVDRSRAFISAAKQIQKNGTFAYMIAEEGFQKRKRIAKLPQGCFPQRVEFRCADVLEILKAPSVYDLVFAANLLCRLKEPLTFLRLLPKVVRSKGQLILISPYSWLEEFTAPEKWLGEAKNGGKTAFQQIQETLETHFTLMRFFDIPYLLREHLRKYQWGVSQASIWKRK